MVTLGEAFTIFLTIFIVVDPLGIVPIFISLTGGLSPARRRSTILKSVLAAFFILCLFVFLGSRILGSLGILPGSFSVAGGILLFLISIDLLFGTPGRTKVSSEDPGQEREDVSVFPLAIPMLAGPGAITTILLQVSDRGVSWPLLAVLLGSVAVSLGCAALTMYLSGFFLKSLGRTGVSVVERLMGLILAGLSVQTVYDGLVTLRVLQGA